MLKSFCNHPEFEIAVATTADIHETVKVEENGVIYYALPSQPPLLYNEHKTENILAWKNLFSEEHFDLIVVWGTEFSHGLCALREARRIPSVIYMQGYVGSIARHYLAGITHRELQKSLTFRDIVKRDSIERQQKRYYRNAEKEKEMLSLSKNVICENDWCENSLRAAVDGLRVFRCPLSINRVFADYRWEAQKTEPYSIISNASGYPLKGQHMLFRAVALLKKKHPALKLYIPGFSAINDKSFAGKLRKRGYTKYLEKLIKELQIEENIVWLGSLTQEELACRYAKTRIFVLCSSIENHSSSLKEAMMVGMPCVASAVGGVPEYVTHGNNAFLYRFGEYDVMASFIEKLFENDSLAAELSERARVSMRSIHSEEEINRIMSEIYRDTVNRETI